MIPSFLIFSDSGKYADIARNIVISGKFFTLFNFWNANNILAIKPFTSYSITFFFRIFGINDFAVVAASFFYFILTLIFLFLLTSKIYKNKFTSVLSMLVVGFNYNILNYAISGSSESPFIFELLTGTYFLSLKKWWGNIMGFMFMVLMYFTRPQAVIYILGLIIYYFLINYSWKKGILYSFITFVLASILYLFFNKQGVIAITQNLPGIAVSNSLRGNIVEFNLIILVKKVFYNLYNFYKALPAIASPYMWGLFFIGIFTWGKDKLQNSFKISVIFMTLVTFLVTALTIPFYRYLHPVIPLVYIIAVATLYEIISKLVNKKYVKIICFVLIFIFCIGQTLGVIFLDSRFKAKLVNKDKPPIYAVMSYKLKEITDPDKVIVTNLDTWGSWYGERKTIWFPLEPSMIIPVEDKIDAIYLTSYLIDDENYYMGENWRKIFENPKDQRILENYKYVGTYEFMAEDNYQKQNGKAVLLIRNDEVK